MPTQVIGSQIKSVPIQYKNHATTSTPNVLIQSGFEFISSGAGGASELTAAVTFPTAFTTILSVVTTINGIITGSDPADITGLNTAGAGDVYSTGLVCSTTGFTLAIRLVSGTFAANQRWGSSWIAIGIQ